MVLDNSTHEEHLSQSLQTHRKQFETAVTVTFLTGYKGIFKNTNNKKNSILQNLSVIKMFSSK